MKLTDKQINWLIKQTDVIEINGSDYDELHTLGHDVTGKPDNTVVWEASFEDEDLIYEETITLGDLRHGEVCDDDDLITADGRVLVFKCGQVIELKELNNEDPN